MAIALLSGGIGGIIAWQLLKVLRKYRLVKNVPQRRQKLFGKKQAEQNAETAESKKNINLQTENLPIKTEDNSNI